MPKTNYHISLKGYVGGWYFSREDVDDVLAQNPDSTVNVLIDSTGGSLAAGLSISAAFRNHGKVNVHFVGLNASAATIASMGAAHISIDAAAMYLVHKCSVDIFKWATMNADQFQTLIDDCSKTKADLDKLDQSVAATYARRCKKPVKDLLDLMKTGAWLTAQEALEWGFVDEITDLDEDTSPVISDQIAAVFSAQGIPFPDVPFEHKDSPISKFIASVSSFFNNNPKPDKPMPNLYATICSLLAVSQINLKADKAMLSADQLNTIEDALQKRDKDIKVAEAKIADLNKQIQDLKKVPADESSKVIEDEKKSSPEKDEVETYVENFNEARRLFDALS